MAAGARRPSHSSPSQVGSAAKRTTAAQRRPQLAPPPPPVNEQTRTPHSSSCSPMPFSPVLTPEPMRQKGVIMVLPA